MVDIPYNPRDDNSEPEYTYCCGTTCDKDKSAWEFETTRQLLKDADAKIVLLEQDLQQALVTNKALGTGQALYYSWYLEECSKREKLSVELEVLKRDKPA